MLVKDIMSTRVEAVAPTMTTDECARRMEQSGIGVLAIRENGQSLGLVTDRDICCRVVGAGRDPAKTQVREVMTKAAAMCFEDEGVFEAAEVMRNEGVRRLMVMDRNHASVGILSVDDLARCSHDLAGKVLEAVAPWPH